MKVPSPSIPVTIGAITLAMTVAGLGCNTRTSIGEVPDAAPGDTSSGDVVSAHGTGGSAEASGGAGRGGATGITGGGGATGEGGLSGSPDGTGGAGGAGAGTGGAGGMSACRAYQMAAGGTAGSTSASCQRLVYPASGFYGPNILADGCTSVTLGSYELAVQHAVDTTVVVQLTLLTSPTSTVAPGVNGWYVDALGDWRTTGISSTGPQQQQTFQSRTLEENETGISFSGAGSARVDVYDCDSTVPSRSKIITWGSAAP